MPTPKDAIFITSPLEDEHVTRIRAAASDWAAVLYEPDLLAPMNRPGFAGGCLF
jgi:hypothetical protein